MGLLVKAKYLGFYNNRRYREGEKFSIESKKDIGEWMEPIGWKAEEKVQTETEAQTIARLRAELVEARASIPPSEEEDEEGDGDETLREKADRLVAKAEEAESTLKQNTPRARKEEIAALRAEADAAVEAADAEDAL